MEMKRTHKVRIGMAAIAVLIFFVTVWFKMTEHPLDFRQPVLAGFLLGFLMLGLASLAYTWITGTDTPAERTITILMGILHIIFDSYIFLRLFVFGQDLPVAIVQAVVEAYWLSGLLDLFFLYRDRNKQLIEGTYVSLEQRVMTLEVANRHLEDTKQTLTDTIEKQQRTIEKASQKHQATCEFCDWEKEYDTATARDHGLSVHQKQWCKGAKLSSNGHRQPQSATA